MSRIEPHAILKRQYALHSLVEAVAHRAARALVNALPIRLRGLLELRLSSRSVLVFVALASACSNTNDDGGQAKSVAMGSCQDEFAACGGDPTGSWEITAACVDGELVEVVDQAFADYPSCKNSVHEAKTKMSAGVTYSSASFERTGSVTITSKMAITAECFAEQTGGTQLSATTCSFYSQVLDSQAGIIGQCSYDGTTCNCDTSNTASLNASGSYQVEGTRISEDSGNQLDFCVAENQLRYHSVLLVTQNETVRVSGTAIMSRNK